MLEEKLLDVGGVLSGSDARPSEASTMRTLTEVSTTRLSASRSIVDRSQSSAAQADPILVERMQSIVNQINALTDEDLMDPVRSMQLPASIGSFSSTPLAHPDASSRLAPQRSAKLPTVATGRSTESSGPPASASQAQQSQQQPQQLQQLRQLGQAQQQQASQENRRSKRPTCFQGTSHWLCC